MGKKISILITLLINLILLTGCENNTINLTKIDAEGIQIGNDFLIKVTNNYNVGKDIAMEISLIDEKGKTLTKLEDTALCVPAKDSSVIIIEDILREDVASYKIKTSAQDSIYTDRTKDISLKAKNTTDTKYPDLDIIVKNQGNEKIDNVEMTVIYYDENKPVGFSWVKHNNLMAGSERTLNAASPRDGSKKLKYTSYRIYRSATQN